MWKYYALLVAYLLLARLPRRINYGIACFVAEAVFLLRADVRRHVQANMRQIQGPEASQSSVRRAAREAVRNAARYYADLIRLPRMDLHHFCEHDLTVEGLHHLQKALAEGRGAVLASAHFGNPEIVVQALALGIRVLVLVEPLEPPQFLRLTQRLRSAHGHTYLPANLSGIKEALRYLRNGGTVAVMIDRDIQRRGVPMPLCGQPAAMPVGAVGLALRTGADLIPCFVHREQGFRYHAYMGPPLSLLHTGDEQKDLLVNSVNLLALFEEHLRTDPGQWAILQPVWTNYDSNSTSWQAPRDSLHGLRTTR
jgi:KDO2-lipid IV(A) lauroyltransferase